MDLVFDSIMESKGNVKDRDRTSHVMAIDLYSSSNWLNLVQATKSPEKEEYRRKVLNISIMSSYRRVAMSFSD